MQYTMNPGINYVFASVVGNHTGYNVSILEVDRTDDNGVIKLIESITSDMISIADIVNIIQPYLLDVEGKQFIGVYTNNNRPTKHRLNAALQCKVSYLNPPNDIGDSLTLIPMRITDGELKVAPHLSGVIESDLQITKPDEIPNNIASLLQLMPDWEILKNGGKYPNGGQSFGRY